MKYVIDACSLIYLTKIGMKEIFLDSFNVIITESVKGELLRDVDKFPDAKIIKKNIDKKKLASTKFEGVNKLESINLGQGELDTIRIALHQELIPITDDLQGIRYAKSKGLKPKTNEIIMIKLLETEMINLKDFIEKLQNLATIKSLSIEIVNFFIEQAESLNRGKMNNMKGENQK